MEQELKEFIEETKLKIPSHFGKITAPTIKNGDNSEPNPLYYQKNVFGFTTHGDGSTTENLSAFKEKYDEILRSGVFQDYSVGVNISVVSEDGHEWVFVWDAAKVAGEDIRYQEAFRIEEGKLLPSTNFQK